MRPRTLAGIGLGVGLGLAGGLALHNRRLTLDDLPPTLPGATHDWTWRGWRVRYTTLGSGPPILLLHSIHAAASAYEIDHLFEGLAARGTVYALEWLGFGKSERPATHYSGALYADLLADFLREVVRGPAVLVGSSLGAAYAVDAAVRQSDHVRWLVLISPVGCTEGGGALRLLGAIIGLPLVGTAAFYALVSRPSLRRFLERVYADPSRVDERLIGQAWAVAHQPNARLAPAAFLAGRLDLPLDDARSRLQSPVLVLRGDRPGLGRQVPDDVLAALGPSVRFETIAGSGPLPHDEAPERVIRAIEGWLRNTSTGQDRGHQKG